MDWDVDVSEKTRKAMHELGCFSPTTRASEKMVKGCLVGKYGESEELYFDSKDLREFAAALAETADFLDARAGVKNAS
jgi:hypothetical protein